MLNPWPAELWRILFVFLGSLFLGLLLHNVSLLLLLGLGAYLLWHLWRLYRLERWLRCGGSIHPPEAEGIWGEVSHHIYRLQQRNRRRKAKLGSILNRFQQAAAAMPDAAVILGPHDEIEWFNDAAQALLGLRPQQDRTQRIRNLLRNPDFIAFLRESREGSVLHMPSPVDAHTSLSVRVIPYGNEQRLLLARDISQQQRLEQIRRDFVANVSHELRTPLTVISGFLETLGEGEEEMPAYLRRSLQLMQQQTTRMQHIVADLLLLSRLETDRSGPQEEVVAVPALLASIREDAQLLAADKGHSIHMECEAGLCLKGAEREIHSAFSNLVSNAVRYTPREGQITIRWYADEEGAHFSVTDTGVGIPAEHIPRLTERFYRVDPGRSREVGGTGLGLAIVKHVLSRHEARLQVESWPGKGSIFTCHFPAHRVVRGGHKAA